MIASKEVMEFRKSSGIEHWWDIPNATEEGYTLAMERFAKAIYAKAIEDAAKVAEECDSTDDNDPHYYCSVEIRKMKEDE